MTRLIIREVAEADLAEASHWYEQERESLGREFVAAARAFMHHICEFPGAYPMVQDEMRRANMRSFPYSVFYVLEDDTVSVLAVMHTSRHPDRWKRRNRES